MKAVCLVVLLCVVSVLTQQPEAKAQAIAAALQSSFYDWNGGLWRSPTGWWNNANALECLVEYMDYSGDHKYENVIQNVWQHTTLPETLNAFFDDMQWWALAWIKAYQLTQNRDYLQRAVAIHNHVVSNAWDGTCGGGVWWSTAKKYKNAITNELFLMLNLQLYQATGDGNYLNWAKTEWQWFSRSGMINSQNLINDGLTPDCKNNGQQTWTYNQGVILGGLAHLAKIENNQTLLTLAQNIVNAVKVHLVHSPNGVLREPCEPNCGNDGPQFKGVFMRYLGFLLPALPNGSDKSATVAWVKSNADSIWNSDRTQSNLCGVVWTGPSNSISGTTQTAALDCFNTNIVASKTA